MKVFLAQEDYLAVDRWNTQNLRNEQKAEEFCENLKLGVEDKIVLYQICEEQLLIRLELQALDRRYIKLTHLTQFFF